MGEILPLYLSMWTTEKVQKGNKHSVVN